MAKIKPVALPHHMRIAALQCNFEGGKNKTLEIPTKWRKMGFNVEQLFHTHADLYSALFEERHQTLLKEYLAEEKANGISVILYMNCHIMLPSQETMKEKWGVRDKDGKFRKLYDDTYYTPCVNSAWSSFFFSQIEALKGFDIAGIFFDGPVLINCFCPVCRNRFREQIGKDIGRANGAELGVFSRQTFLNFVKESYLKVKEVNPAWISYTNVPIMHGPWSAMEMREMLQYEDIIGTEGGFFFYGPPKDTPIFKCSLAAKMIESVAQERPCVIFMAGDHKPWSWYLHTASETKLCYASAIANGASVWYGIHCSTDMLDAAGGKAAAEMLAFDKANSQYYARTESLARTALFYSFATAATYKSAQEASDFYGHDAQNRESPVEQGIGNYLAGVHGASGMLSHLGIPFDLITELSLDRLGRYQIIVAPNAACLDAKTVAAFDKFVKEGGRLIADGETSLFDENMHRKDDFALSALFGASFAGTYITYNQWDYFRLEPEHANLIADQGVKYIPAPLAAPAISSHASAHVIARLCPPLKGRYAGKPGTPERPFITRKNTGRGSACFIAGTFFEFYSSYGIVHYREILRNLAFVERPEPFQLLNLPESVQISVRKTLPSGQTLVHLVNYAGSTARPIERVIGIHGVELRTPKSCKSARSLTRGRKLLRSKSGTFIVPEFKEFEVILLAEN